MYISQNVYTTKINPRKIPLIIPKISIPIHFVLGI